MTNGTFFEIDWTATGIAFVILLLAYFIHKWKQKFSTPHVIFPNLNDLKKAENASNWVPYFRNLAQYFLYLSFALFVLAFIDPHFLVSKKSTPKDSSPKEGIAIYLVIDRSGSMKDPVSSLSASGEHSSMSKEDIVKRVTTEFINGDPAIGLEGRPNDLIGLITLARSAQILSPLTLNHQFLIDQLAKIEPVTNPEEDGTSIGYAIFKTVNLIAATRHYAQELVGANQPSYDIKSSIILVLTDGLQQPNPGDRGNHLRNMDLVESADYAKKNNVRLYLINVDPAINSEEFTPQREQMQQITKLTGGNFFLVNESNNLSAIYATIDQLEKSKIPIDAMASDRPKDKQPDKYTRTSLFPMLIMLGLIFLFTSIVTDSLIYRRVP